MTRVFFTQETQLKIEHVLPLALPDLVIMITQDARTDALTARFMDRETTQTLKTSNLGEVYPGLEVHLFGVEKAVEGMNLVLDLQTVRVGKRERPHPLEDTCQYLFRVFPSHAASMHLPKSKAS